jgi:hypothetical protein
MAGATAVGRLVEHYAADVEQVFGPDGSYHAFVDSGEIDDEGFVILNEEPIEK